MVAAQHFVLLRAAADADGAKLQEISVPDKPVYLRHSRRRRPGLSGRRPAPAVLPSTVVLEPILVGGQSQLLMLCGAAAAVSCNGRPAQPVTLLQERDELRAGAHIFFVTTARSPGVGSPGPAQVGATCPVCLVPVVAENRVYVCHHCGVVLHCEDDEVAEDQRLECAALVSECPNCRRDIEFDSGLSWYPEL